MAQIESIFDIELANLCARLADQNYRIHVKPSARRYLIEKGWDPKFGGRPLRRTLQKELEESLACMLLARDWPSGTVFTANCREGKIKLTGKAPLVIPAYGDAEYQEIIEETVERDIVEEVLMK